jgi:hypothetical protein
MLARGQVLPQRMNKTEASYAQQLELLRRAGEILWYKYEGISLKLADDTRYIPDFFVMKKDFSLECHEVKGFFHQHSKVKVKVAVEMFPFKFILIRKTKAGWNEEHYS